MPRRSRTQITKQHARKIIKKLKAVNITHPSDEHDEFGVYHNGKLEATFGIRRGSRPGSGHDHIPGELDVGPNFAKDLANCPKSRDDYLRTRNLLKEPDVNDAGSPQEEIDQDDVSDTNDKGE